MIIYIVFNADLSIIKAFESAGAAVDFIRDLPGYTIREVHLLLESPNLNWD